jgi:tetratricopeptide (TPR) repeat protein
MRNRIRIIFFVGTVLFFPSFNAYADPRVGEIYFGFADDLYRTGQYEDSLQLLDMALQFNAGSSDTLFLKSLILGQQKGNRLEARETARRALDFNTWKNFTADNGRLFLARLLRDTHRFEEALLLLETVENLKNADPDYFIIKTLCYRGIGDLPRAIKTVRSGMDMFPLDYRFPEQYFRIKNRIDPGDFSLLENRKAGDTSYLSALLVFAELSKVPEEKLSLAKEYFELRGSDPRASALIIENETEGKEKEIARFISLGGLSQIRTVRRIIDTLEGTGKNDFEKILRTYSGNSIIDDDFDGLSEEVFIIRDGNVIEWRVDHNQDGRDEIIFGFSDKDVRTLSLFDGMASVTIDFSRYPMVEKISHLHGDVNREYHISPGRFNLSIFKKGPQSNTFPEFLKKMDYEIDKKSLFITLSDVKNVSNRIVEKGPSNSFYHIYRLSSGRVQSFEEIVQRDGKSGVLRRIYFQNDKARSGERDLDGDGIFEIVETYLNGVLQTLHVDSSFDGTPEYRESALENAFKEWDFDGDGKIDAREYKIGKNRVKREFSTYWDWIFDSTAIDVRKFDRSDFSIIGMDP